VTELLVPGIVDDPFREHYRELIRSSLLRTIEAETAERSSRSRRRRVERSLAVLADDQAALVVELPPAVPVRSRLRVAAPVVWGLAVVLLVVDTIAFGITSLATGIADVAVVALTGVWFAVSLEGRAAVVVPEAPPAEAERPLDEIEGIDGVEVLPLPMQRDGGGHVTDLLPSDGWQAVSCRAGTLRGMHAHARGDDLRIVVQGRAALGLHDLRPGSPTERRSALLQLSGDEYCAVRIPAGVAHGVYALSDALVLVGVSARGEDEELGCVWNDPGLGIEWPGEPQFLSDRDRHAGPLSVLAEEFAHTV